MNTQLEKLFDVYQISQKDRHEIRQIYSLLALHKQRELLENFATIAAKFHQIEEEIRVQRELLIWDKVDEIKQIILKNREKRMVQSEIHELKETI